MPTFGNISVNDGATTPVAHVFSPVTVDNGLARYANRAATTPMGQETLSIQSIEPKGPTQAYTSVLKGYLPVTATVNGVETLVRYASFEVRINNSQSSTVQERKNTRVLAANALLSATMASVVDDTSPVYGG